VVSVEIGVRAAGDDREYGEERDREHDLRLVAPPRLTRGGDGVAVLHYARSSDSGNDRWARGGTRKFWGGGVFSTPLKPWPREPGVNARVCPGRWPSIASRPRRKSSLVGLKTTKCRPAAGAAWYPSRSGAALQAKGLSSVLKSARCGIGVPFSYSTPSG